MKKTDAVGIDPRQIRLRLGLSQEEFWTRIGVTQSGGSRYESGRRLSKPVRELLRIVHIEQIDLSRINRKDLKAVEFLKVNQPDSYNCLHKEIVAKLEKSRELQPAPPSKTCPLGMSGIQCHPTTKSRCRQWWQSIVK